MDWIFEKTFKVRCFSTVFECPEDSFWMTLGVILGLLGGLWAVLGASWALGGRLGGVLVVFGNAWER